MNLKTITVHTYHTADGTPTCCLRAGTKYCKFLGARRFGQQPVCMLGEQVDLQRDDDGFIRPHDKCGLHSADSHVGQKKEEYYVHFEICGEPVLYRRNFPGPIEYHDCKPVPGAKLDAARKEINRLQMALTTIVEMADRPGWDTRDLDMAAIAARSLAVANGEVTV